MVTYPAFKACEPHVVLVGLTGMAALAVVSAPAWVEAWRWSVRGMMALAPTLATLRVARAIRGGSSEAEFARWFRPEDRAIDDQREATPL